MIELHARVHGRVQMVMYRDFAQRKARSRGITGWVKNLPDGAVEVLAQGEHPMLEKYLERLKRGPLFARVETVEVEWREARGRCPDFVVHYD